MGEEKKMSVVTNGATEFVGRIAMHTSGAGGGEKTSLIPQNTGDLQRDRVSGLSRTRAENDGPDGHTLEAGARLRRLRELMMAGQKRSDLQLP
jgi:hypothetical protein